MEINSKSLKIFRKDFKDAIKGLEEKYGIEITLGNISFCHDRFHSKMECTSITAIKSPEEEFAANCIYTFGLIKPDMYSQEFKAKNGKTYRLTGIRPNAPKNFCIITDVRTGKEFVSPPDFLGIVRDVG